MKSHVHQRNLRYFALALALFFAVAVAGCALPSPVPVEDDASQTYTGGTSNSSSSSASGDYFVEVTDMAGNSVRLETAPSGIVVLDPADCEILYAIGAGDFVTGRTADCDYPDEANAVPYVTMDGKADADLILLREPNLVVMGADYAADADIVSALNDAGIPIVVTNATDINGAYSAITLLGVVTGHETEASALISSIITSLAELQGKVTDHSQTVYLELSPLSDGLTTAGGNTFAASLISFLGFHDEFEDQEGTLSITQDQVIGRSPSYIITTTAGSWADTATTEDETQTPEPEPEGYASVAEILARTDWETITAVSQQHVYYIDGALITRAGPRIVEAANALYTALYENTQP